MVSFSSPSQLGKVNLIYLNELWWLSREVQAWLRGNPARLKLAVSRYERELGNICVFVVNENINTRVFLINSYVS